MNPEQTVAKISHRFQLFYLLYVSIVACFVLISFLDFFWQFNFIANTFPFINHREHTVFEKIFVAVSLANVLFYFIVFFNNYKIWHIEDYNFETSRRNWLLNIIVHSSSLLLYFVCTKLYFPALTFTNISSLDSLLLSAVFMLPAIPLLLCIFGFIENRLISSAANFSLAE